MRLIERKRRFSKYIYDRGILLSIHANYVELIKRGVKKYEFRKNIIRPDIDVGFIVLPNSGGIVDIMFDVAQIIHGPKIDLWEKTKDEAGIDETCFNNYFGNCKDCYAIEIGTVYYCESFNSFSVLAKKPPQRPVYIDDLKNRLVGLRRRICYRR